MSTAANHFIEFATHVEIDPPIIIDVEQRGDRDPYKFEVSTAYFRNGALVRLRGMRIKKTGARYGQHSFVIGPIRIDAPDGSLSGLRFGNDTVVALGLAAVAAVHAHRYEAAVKAAGTGFPDPEQIG